MTGMSTLQESARLRVSSASSPFRPSIGFQIKYWPYHNQLFERLLASAASVTPNDIRNWFAYPAITALSVFASCRFSPVSLYWSYSPTSDANNTNVYAPSDMYNAVTGRSARSQLPLLLVLVKVIIIVLVRIVLARY